MMTGKTFIESVVEEIESNAHTDYSKVWVVFPNKRAGIYFNEAFKNSVKNKASWIPRVLTIEDLFTELCPFPVAERLTLLIELYHSFKKHSPVDETFDRFFPWADMLYKDFNEIDSNRVNAKALFKFLSSQKEIDTVFELLDDEQLEAFNKFWINVSGSRISDQKRAFESIWKILGDVYQDYDDSLKSMKIVTEGKAARWVAEHLDEIVLTCDHVYFCGFNALNICEVDLIKHLAQKNNANVLWDADKYYLDDSMHEAGTFIRKYRNSFPRSKVITTDYYNADKKVISYSVPLIAGQSKVTGELLNNTVSPGPDTAIILPDESLLFPVLGSLPENVEHFNVTMGYSLSRTPVINLVNTLFDLFEREDSKSFYYKPLISLLEHPFITSLFPARTKHIVRDIRSNNRIRIKYDDLLKGNEHELFEHLFTKPPEYNVVSALVKIFDAIFHRFKNDSRYVIDREFVYAAFIELKRLNKTLADNNIVVSYSILRKLVIQALGTVKIPFTGEPVLGTQVMGFLETRCLDYKNIIVLSVNEGSLPSKGSAGSFIPHNLRKIFGMPTRDLQDAIMSYHFFRLIQRAQNVFLLSNSETMNGLTGEKSRFIHQLALESKVSFSEKVVSGSVLINKSPDILVKKETELIDKLRRYTGDDERHKSLSATAISTYLDCGLKFYFKHVCNIYQPEEISELIDPGMFGEILHFVLEDLYKPFVNIGKVINIPEIDKLKKQLLDSDLTEKACEKVYGKENFSSVGRNHLVIQVIRKLVIKILDEDKRYAPFEIKALETDDKDNYTMYIPIKTNSGYFEISLKAKIDRIDVKEGITRIVDYKSGIVERKFAEVDDLFGEKMNKTIHQALFYSLLYNHKKPDDKLAIGIISTRDLFASNYTWRIMKNNKPLDSIDTEMINRYKENLNDLLGRIYGNDEVFSQTEDLAICEYCDYKNICGR